MMAAGNPTATQKAAAGAEEARMEGKGVGGQAVEAAKNVATGRDGPLKRPPGMVGATDLNRPGMANTEMNRPGMLGSEMNRPGMVGSEMNRPGMMGSEMNRPGMMGSEMNRTGMVGPHTGGVGTDLNGDSIADRGIMGPGHHHNHHTHGGLMERTEEEVARLRNRTQITHEGEAYCPNPNLRDLPKEFETRVQVIQRYPEMKTVEKTDFVKEIHHEERTILVPKTRVIMDEVERIDRVPVVKKVPKIRIEITHRVVTDEREVTDMVPVVEYVDVPRIEQVPRVITEEIEEVITVPVVREVPVTRMVEVPTGNYCEAPAGEFVNPGHFNLLNKHHVGHEHHAGQKAGLLHRTKSLSSSSSSSSDDEVIEGNGVMGTHGHNAGTNSLDGTNVHHNLDDTTTLDSPTGHKKKSLLQRIIHH